jgi:hypothetical protein
LLTARSRLRLAATLSMANDSDEDITYIGWDLPAELRLQRSTRSALLTNVTSDTSGRRTSSTGTDTSASSARERIESSRRRIQTSHQHRSRREDLIDLTLESDDDSANTPRLSRFPLALNHDFKHSPSVQPSTSLRYNPIGTYVSFSPTYRAGTKSLQSITDNKYQCRVRVQRWR